jgi:apoptosis-inducing factor 3
MRKRLFPLSLTNDFQILYFSPQKEVTLIDRILEAPKTATHAVVICSRFIGMKAVAGLAQQGINVTVFSPDTVPFEKTLGQEIGSIFQQVHEEEGIYVQ